MRILYIERIDYLYIVTVPCCYLHNYINILNLERHWIFFSIFLVVTVITDCQVILESVAIPIGLSIMIDSSSNAGEELGRIIIFINLRRGIFIIRLIHRQQYLPVLLPPPVVWSSPQCSRRCILRWDPGTGGSSCWGLARPRALRWLPAGCCISEWAGRLRTRRTARRTARN